MEYKRIASKKMIHIAYYFPPIKSVGVNRSNRLANELASFFYSYTVFTTSNRNRLPSQTLPIDDSIRVVEVPTFDFRTVLSFFRKKDRVHFNTDFKKKFFLVWWAKLIASFPFNILFGQGGLIYIFTAFVKISRDVKKESDNFVILSVFHPYADHIVAYLVKRRFPKVLWIADFKDLHIDPVYRNYLWKPIQIWFNKKILKKANFLTTVSEGLAQNLKQFHEDIFILPNGTNQLEVQRKLRDDKFVISYTGSMYQGKAQLFFEALKALIEDGEISQDDIKLQQAGRDGDVWQAWVSKYGLTDVFLSKGVVSMSSAQKMQAESHVNLLFSTSHDGYKGIMTSKIYEYLAASNPIFVVIDGPKDEYFERALSGIDDIFIGYDAESIGRAKSFLLNLYLAWKDGKYPQISRSSWDKRYYWPKMIRRFLEKLELELN